MTKFKDIIFEPNVVIHCPEEWMANELLRYADSKGRRWRFKNKHLKDTFWYVYQENTAYQMSLVAFNDIDEFKRRGFKILHYNDVVIKEGE